MNACTIRQAERLASLLSRRLLAELPHDMLQVIDRERYRHIRLGGFFRMAIDMSGTRRRIQVRRSLGGEWQPMSDWDLSISHPLSTSHWIRFWLTGPQQQEILQSMEFQPSDKFTRQLPERIKELINHHPAVKDLRRRFVAAYCPDVVVLALCREMHRGKATGMHYRQMLAYLPHLKRMQMDNPNLFELLRLLVLQQPAWLPKLAGDGYWNLKAGLAKKAVPKAIWRLASKHGKALWAPIQNVRCFRNDTVEELKLLGQLLVGSGLKGLPPPALLTLWYKSSEQIQSEPEDLNLFNPLFGLAWRHWLQTVGTAGKAALLAEIAPVVADWAALIHNRPKPLPKAATWDSAKRRIAQGIARHRSMQSKEPWPMPEDVYRRGAYEFTPVNSTVMAFDVGMALRNCLVDVTGFNDERMRGCPHYLLRQHGKPVALLRLIKCGGLNTLLGFANGNVPDAWWGMAKEFAEALELRYPEGLVPDNSDLEESDERSARSHCLYFDLTETAAA